MKKYLLVFSIILILHACGESGEGEKTPAKTETASSSPDYDAKRGEGKFKDVEIPASIDKTMADAGEKVYTVKCASCHKLSEERLVGPGWQGVTTRRTAAWIMNFVTNTEEMLSKDPAAQAQLEICLVRMPNQNLTDQDARSVYEFMRKHDGIK